MTVSIRLEFLPGPQRQFWPELSPASKLGMVLYGGTAIAAREMYGKQFQPSESLKALVYFEGGDLDTLTYDVNSDLKLIQFFDKQRFKTDTPPSSFAARGAHVRPSRALVCIIPACR